MTLEISQSHMPETTWKISAGVIPRSPHKLQIQEFTLPVVLDLLLCSLPRAAGSPASSASRTPAKTRQYSNAGRSLLLLYAFTCLSDKYVVTHNELMFWKYFKIFTWEMPQKCKMLLLAGRKLVIHISWGNHYKQWEKSPPLSNALKKPQTVKCVKLLVDSLVLSIVVCYCLFESWNIINPLWCMVCGWCMTLHFWLTRESWHEKTIFVLENADLALEKRWLHWMFL